MRYIFSSFLFHTILVLIAGSILTLAFHPFDQFYAAPISLAALLYVLDNNRYRSKKQQFLLGFLFGISHFSTSLYWISYSLFVEADKFAWLAPIPILLIPACIAIFIGILALIITPYIDVSKISAALIFPSLWVILEILRSSLIFPFPWNLLGYASNFSIELMQIASVIGVYGLSFFFALCGSALYSRNISLIFGVLLLTLAIYSWGNWKIDNGIRNIDINHESINLRLIQPNINEQHFGDLDKQVNALNQLISLSLQKDLDQVDFLIWPESAFPFTIIPNSPWLLKLRQLLPPRTTLLFGTDRYEEVDGVSKVYNSLISINNHNDNIDIYDKIILVPFGEYQPFRLFFPFIDKITYGMQDFEPGSIGNILKTKQWQNINPFICYEAIFSPRIFNNMLKKSLFLLNITNDFWFGDSIGPYQHFAMARMRAIEYGVPLVRVANTGISAVIDAYGNILKRLDLNSSGTIDVSMKTYPVMDSYVFDLHDVLLLFLILLGLVVGVANCVIHLYK